MRESNSERSKRHKREVLTWLLVLYIILGFAKHLENRTNSKKKTRMSQITLATAKNKMCPIWLVH